MEDLVVVEVVTRFFCLLSVPEFHISPIVQRARKMHDFPTMAANTDIIRSHWATTDGTAHVDTGKSRSLTFQTNHILLLYWVKLYKVNRRSSPVKEFKQKLQIEFELISPLLQEKFHIRAILLHTCVCYQLHVSCLEKLSECTRSLAGHRLRASFVSRLLHARQYLCADYKSP